MIKRLYAQKQKDIRNTYYDPEQDTISKIISEFQAYLKSAKFYKEYSEIDKFKNFQEIRWMKIMDERTTSIRDEAKERQDKIRVRWESYIEYEKWSDSPAAQKAKPLSKMSRILIIFGVLILIGIMLTIIIGLNGWGYGK
ncbi:hypothetical protein FJO69_02565 [[Mycoplasma] falconis]|uniref:Uncharacterized protein n=1 Tax=[Mycoplasma] falconis TaxID=92403 RepID=A0A501X8V7_9BACT|nr:hypothetical protein [[Mycoplasma] falconis]TPE56971.1 hypothetical protein FJO69_02565 [[Mycoplasma] falconis]